MMDAIRQNADAVRDKCRDFCEFAKLAWDIIEPGTPLKWSWHLTAMCQHLQAISEGKLHPRLIINVPPGSSKSTIVTVLWQAYEWGPLGKRHLRYVTTSFELGNVKRDNAKCRDLIQSEWYQALWPDTELKTAGVLSFSNSYTGTRLGVAFKSVMGKRGDRLIVDDPHSLKGAESELQRTETIRLFIEGGLNRTNDAITSVIVIVMQRVHENDLTGALLAKDFGFIHLMIPMEFEPDRRCTTPLKVKQPDGTKKDWTDPRSYAGELMDPVREPPAVIAQRKLSGEYMWNGQYQQRPAPREGGLFKVDRINIISHDPGGGEVCRGWDLAGTKRKTSAYTAGLKLRRVNGRFIICDVDRAQETPAGVKAMVLKCAENDGLLCRQSLPQDPGQAGVAQKHDYADMLAGHNFRFSTETGDKQTRALPAAASVENGIVDMVKGDWNEAFLEELRGFPSMTLKDQVDALSRAYAELVSGQTAIENAAPEIVHVDEEPALVDDDDPWSGLD